MNQFDTAAAVGALHPRGPGMEIGFVLEEVEMPPLFLNGVMHWRERSTHGVWELPAPLEVNMDVKAV